MKIILALLLTLLPLTVTAQTVVGRNLTVGPSPTMPSGTTVRLDGLGTVGGTTLLFTDGDGDVFERILAAADIPAGFARTDTANTWDLLQTFSSGISLNAGTVGTPALRFTTDTNTGVYLVGADSLGISTGGVNRFTVNATGTSVAGTLGVTGATTLSNTLGVTGIATFSDRVRGVAGTAAAPSFTGTDTDTGMYFSSGNTINWSTGGTLRGTLTSTALTLVPDLAVNGGDITSTAANLNITPVTSVTMGGDLIMSSAHQMRSAHYASATTGWGLTYDGALDARYIYVDEMHAKAFIADLEMALNGGQVIAKSTAILAQDFTCPAAGATATLHVNDFPGFPNIRAFAVNDWVVLRTFSRTDADNDGNTDLTIGDCVGQVSAYVDGSGGTENTQQWTFTRGSGGNAGAMTAATVVNADAIVIDFGVSGQGFLIARANDGAEGANSPYWQVVTWTTSPVTANMRLQTRFGQLNGSYGYSTSTYGFAAGDASDVFVAVDPTNGFRIMEGGTNQKVRVATDGSILLGSTSAGAENVYIDATQILLRQGTTSLLRASSADGLQFYNNSGALRMFLNATDGVVVGDTGGTNTFAQITDSTFAISRGVGNTRVVINSAGIGLYDESTTRRIFLGDLGGGSSYGVVLGDSGTLNQTFLQYASGTGDMNFCRAGVGCYLNFDGPTGNITSSGSILLSGGNITSTGNFSLSGNGLNFSSNTSGSPTAGRSITWGGTGFSDPYIYGGNTGGDHLWIDPGSSGTLRVSNTDDTTYLAGDIYLQPDGAGVGNYQFAMTSGGLFFGTSSFAGEGFQLSISGVTTTLTPGQDGTMLLGTPSNRVGNMNLALPANTAPTFFVVNKGGGGADAASALGYRAAGISTDIYVRNQSNTGACYIEVTAGLITSHTCP